MLKSVTLCVLESPWVKSQLNRQLQMGHERGAEHQNHKVPKQKQCLWRCTVVFPYLGIHYCKQKPILGHRMGQDNELFPIFFSYNIGKFEIYKSGCGRFSFTTPPSKHYVICHFNTFILMPECTYLNKITKMTNYTLIK